MNLRLLYRFLKPHNDFKVGDPMPSSMRGSFHYLRRAGIIGTKAELAALLCTQETVVEVNQETVVEEAPKKRGRPKKEG